MFPLVALFHIAMLLLTVFTTTATEPFPSTRLVAAFVDALLCHKLDLPAAI